MKTDNFGSYDENKIPYELDLPVKVNTENNALTDSYGRIVASYGFSHDSLENNNVKRKLEFFCRLANGELMIDNGKVYVRFGQQYQDGEIVVRYVPIGNLNKDHSGNGHSKIDKKVKLK